MELYEAQNAVQIAQSAEAERYAPQTLAKAQDLLRRAQYAQGRKAGVTSVVTLARQAAQTAEDARILAIQRKQDSELARAREQAARAEALRAQAEAAAQTAQSQAAADRTLLEQERAAKQRAEAQAAAAAVAAAQQAPPTPAPPRPAPDRDEAQKKELRLLLLEQFNAVLSARDTPRGLMLTVPDSDFQGTRMSPAVYERLARVVSVLRAHPDLTVEVDGHERFSSERAEAVRDVLVSDGLPAGAVLARGLGDTRPLASNASAVGREQNRRVEIIVSGNPIGDMPYWARRYTLVP